MKHVYWITLNLLTASAMAFAQDSQTSAPQNGGWRRVADSGATVASAGNQDSMQAARTDAYGQPLPQQQDAPQPAYSSNQPATPPMNAPENQAPPAQMQRNDRPPAAVPHYGLPPAVTIKAGTFVTARVNQELSSDHNQAGDVFSATLTQPIVVDGVVVAQRGQTVMGRVAEATKAGRAKGVSHLALQITGINMADGTEAAVQSHVVTRNGDTSVGRDVAAVGTTTAVGAGIGAAADWGRGAAIGAGAGAAAGLVGVLLTRGHPTIVYPETLLTFQLESPVTVDLTRAPQAFRFVGPDDYNHNGTQTTTVVRRAPYNGYYGPGYYGYPYYGYYGYGYPYYWGPSFGIGFRYGGGFRRWR